MRTQTELREAALERRIVANLGRVWDDITDLSGRPHYNVCALNKDAEHRPRINQIKFLDENGRWVMYGDGSKGSGIIDLVMHLGVCERAPAVAFLERLASTLKQ